MKYRDLGRTGLRVSEIGLGCEGFAKNDAAFAKAVFDVAEQQGVNYLDLYTSDPAVRSKIGEAMLGRREKIIVQGHICSTWQDGQYKRTRSLPEVQAGFADLLDRLRTEYIGVGMIHYVDSIEDWREVCDGPVMDYVNTLKDQQKIRHIGLSSHNPVVALEAIRSGAIDVLMFSINPCYDMQPGNEDIELLWADESYAKPLLNMDPDRQALYEACEQMGVGISVMKALGGGDLLDDSLSPAGKSLTLYQCMHYALTRPGVSTVLCGAHTLDQFTDSLGYEDAPESEKDYAAALAALPKISWKGHCMYCSHCAPCPVGIDVASVTKFLNLAKAQGEVPETVREHYALLAHHAKACVQCGACEKRCPFAVSIRQNMTEAAILFGY